MLYGDWIGRWGSSFPNKEALVDLVGNRRYTYGELADEIHKMANFLRKECGVVKGDRVAILALNRVEYIKLFFGASRLGAILVPLNIRLAPNEFIYYLQDAEPKAFFFDKNYLAIIDGLKSKVKIPHYVCIDDDNTVGKSLPAAWGGLSTQRPPEVDIKPADPQLIIYTSGTTGLAKGALLSHGMITWNSINTNIGWDLTSHDIATIHMNMFYTGGWNIFHLPLFHCRGKNILMAGFDVDQILDIIPKEKVTLFVGVPTMFQMLLASPKFEKTDFSSLRLIGNGGAPLPRKVRDVFAAKGITMMEGYGLTEVGPNNFLGWGKPGTLGKPMLHVDMRIVDNDGKDVPQGQEGELLLTGEHMLIGYWNKPEATKDAMPDGWFHTGDLFKIDEDGDYAVVGRKKDMIKSGGANVYPAEIEAYIIQHPAVAMAAVIGVPDEKWDEIGKACVVLKPGQSLTLEQLQEFLSSRLGKFKIPKYMVIVKELPLTVATGKVQKFILKKDHGKPDNN
jgi:fatty-acyl-CoA synthase